MPKKKKKRGGFGLFVALVIGGVVGYKIREGLGAGATNGNGDDDDYDDQEQTRWIEDRVRRIEDDHDRLWRQYR